MDAPFLQFLGSLDYRITGEAAFGKRFRRFETLM